MFGVKSEHAFTEPRKSKIEERGMKMQENKMGVMPVNKLLLTMSVPMIISMLIQAFYNVVDSIYVAQINENALTAVSLAFPVQSVMIAVSTGIGVGVNAVLSKRLGEKRREEVDKTANVSVLLAGLSYLVFLAVGLFCSRWFFAIQTEDAEIIAFGATYMSIVCTMSFGLFFQICFEKLLQSTGRTFYSMIMQGTGAIINIVLDPILIFGYLGFPAMGIAGAAVATVIGQTAGSLLGLLFNIKVNKEIHLHVKKMTFDAPIVKEVFRIGVPAILMQSIGSVMVFLMNKILMGFTTTASAVFGVYFRLQSIIFMPIFGLSNGMIPIVAYNYGAGNRERMVKATKYSMIYATAMMVVGLLLAQIIPGQLLMMFDASENMLAIGIPALRILCTCFLFAGFNITASSLFQAVGDSVYSLVMSMIRQLVVLLPVAWLLSLTGELNAVWLSFPIAELVATIVTLILLKKTMKKLTKTMSSHW